MMTANEARVVATEDDYGDSYFYRGDVTNNNNIVAKNVVLDEEGSKFDCYIDNELYGHFEVPLFGKHMVMDAAAAIILWEMKKHILQ